MAKKILIIDDEVDVSRMIAIRLKAKGYEVSSASTGKAGIDLADELKPDLLLLDYRLPDMLSSKIAGEIRGKDGLQRIPIILITATSEYIEERAKECLASDYMMKPIEPEALYVKVEKQIGV